MENKRFLVLPDPKDPDAPEEFRKVIDYFHGMAELRKKMTPEEREVYDKKLREIEERIRKQTD